MSDYIKTNWMDGDIITAEKLNNMENGIAKENPQIIIDLTDVQKISSETGLFYPYKEGLTMKDLIGSTIITIFSNGASSKIGTAYPILMASDSNSDYLALFSIIYRSGVVLQSIQYYPTTENKYSQSGFFIVSTAT